MPVCFRPKAWLWRDLIPYGAAMPPTPTAPRSAERMQQGLTARALTKRYGQTVAIDNVELSLGPGEIVAVLGPSGSGKSTLLHCLALMTSADEGELVFEGRSLRGLTEDDRSALRRRSFGFVFQFGDLVDELSLRENVMLPLVFNGASVRAALQGADELLGHLGLQDVARRRPSEVSGGQAQRAAVARAVIHRPAVIFADEPTGALDSVAGAVVLATLVDLAREHRSTVVLVTHDDRVAAVADRQVEMLDGRIVRDDRAR
jgi:putative ABC transport system ATP-binding protein